MDALEKYVWTIFDEVFVELAQMEKYHPSEEYNRTQRRPEILDGDNIYDVMNSYHGFCRVCHRHFYTKTVADDINSFFYKHMNTSYHRQVLTLDRLPQDTPMFTWEESFMTGHCNVCEMSNIQAYVIDTELTIQYVLKTHQCLIPRERFPSSDYLCKIGALRKYSRSRLFREKTIRTVNGTRVCVMCQVTLPWQDDDSYCHLSSDMHFENFCNFLYDALGFEPKDALNGYNLETITRFVASQDEKSNPVTEYKDFDERDRCFEMSNSIRRPYGIGDSLSFCPVEIRDKLDDESSDLICEKKCLVCDVEVDDEHFESLSHIRRTTKIERKIFKDDGRYMMYWKNKLRRQRIKNTFMTLQKDVKDRASGKFDDSEKGFLKRLLDKKLHAVELTFSLSDHLDVYCEVCNLRPIYKPDDHAMSGTHHSNELDWKTVQKMSENERFFEPFKMTTSKILCITCGALYHPNETFFEHLKSLVHVGKFYDYVRVDGPPLSETFAIDPERGCECLECGEEVLTIADTNDLPHGVELILAHWNVHCRDEVNISPADKELGHAVATLSEKTADLVLEASTLAVDLSDELAAASRTTSVGANQQQAKKVPQKSKKPTGASEELKLTPGESSLASAIHDVNSRPTTSKEQEQSSINKSCTSKGANIEGREQLAQEKLEQTPESSFLSVRSKEKTHEKKKNQEKKDVDPEVEKRIEQHRKKEHENDDEVLVVSGCYVIIPRKKHRESEM